MNAKIHWLMATHWAEFGEFTVRAQLVTAGRDGVIRRNLKVQAKVWE